MKTWNQSAKAAILASALAIVALSAAPKAADAIVCEFVGHSCHVMIEGTLYHMVKVSV